MKICENKIPIQRDFLNIFRNFLFALNGVEFCARCRDNNIFRRIFPIFRIDFARFYLHRNRLDFRMHIRVDFFEQLLKSFWIFQNCVQIITKIIDNARANFGIVVQDAYRAIQKFLLLFGKLHDIFILLFICKIFRRSISHK